MGSFNSFQGSGSEPHYNYKQAGFGNGPSQIQRILMIVGILIAVVIVIIVFFNFVSGSDDSGPQQDLARIATRQKDIIGIIDTYGTNVRSLQIQNKAALAEAVLISDQQSLNAIGAGASLPASAVDSTAASRLDKAATSTTFDDVFDDILTEELEVNVADIQAVLASTSNKKIQDALTIALANQSALIE